MRNYSFFVVEGKALETGGQQAIPTDAQFEETNPRLPLLRQTDGQLTQQKFEEIEAQRTSRIRQTSQRCGSKTGY